MSAIGKVNAIMASQGKTVPNNVWTLGANPSQPLFTLKPINIDLDFSGLKGFNSSLVGLNDLANSLASYTSLANKLSAQSAREAMAFEASEAEKNRLWQDQQRQASQAYNSAEALAAREWSTSERLAQQQFNSAEALKNREWQEYMSNTAVQRQVKDLIAAGINPILAAQLGGASVGSGATASSSIPGSTSASSTFGSGAKGSGHSYQAVNSHTAEMIQLLGMALGMIGNVLESPGSASSASKVLEYGSKLASDAKNWIKNSEKNISDKLFGEGAYKQAMKNKEYWDAYYKNKFGY